MSFDAKSEYMHVFYLRYPFPQQIDVPLPTNAMHEHYQKVSYCCRRGNEFYCYLQTQLIIDVMFPDHLCPSKNTCTTHKNLSQLIYANRYLYWADP